MGIPDGRKSFKIGLPVLIQYRRVTDSQPPSYVAVASTRYTYVSASRSKKRAMERRHRVFVVPWQRHDHVVVIDPTVRRPTCNTLSHAFMNTFTATVYTWCVRACRRGGRVDGRGRWMPTIRVDHEGLRAYVSAAGARSLSVMLKSRTPCTGMA